ncbi:hypothetical protein [Herbaspirillum robiniae]|uniref:Uncharacterized protein n=1 Tax=Herbaspirillum robiniae TaxID=2014887 RepID=A0ABX2LYT4_9BURK|nr:hypothetical protein [Herbaspirillum robiniae]NUU02834.1 hypothetical protein [Herbaspirillum robiniae]
MHTKYNESTAPMKDLMTVAPIDPSLHAALLRDRVAVRRLIEDLMEAARQRREETLQD